MRRQGGDRILFFNLFALSFNNKMNPFDRGGNTSQENKALQSLIEISDQTASQEIRFFKKNVSLLRERNGNFNRKRMSIVVNLEESRSKGKRLPLILNKSNLDRSSLELAK